MLNSTSLDSILLSGLEADCLSLYQDEYADIKTFFATINFLTKSEGGCLEMSQVGKAVENSLITGEPLRLPFSAFNKCKDGTSLPSLGYFLWSRVFHVATREPLIRFLAKQGTYSYYDRETVSTEPIYANRLDRAESQSFACAVFFLRQVLLIHSKRTDLPTIADEVDEVESFQTRITTQRDINLSRGVVKAAKEYLRRIFLDPSEEDCDRLHPSLENWLVNPFGKHGPGAVFDGEIGVDKWEFCESITARITHPEFIDPTTEASASKSRLTVVPKDFRKHRLICIEQKEMMFFQQGLRTVVEHLVHSNPLSERCINYKDQGLNFRLSKDMRFSTIDLSDASDLLSRRLCKLLLPAKVYKLFVNGRASRISLPSGTEIAYEAMYTMGNALCFTLESIMFSALVCAAISVYSGKSLDSAKFSYRVFGDDIIVKNQYYDFVLSVLQTAGLVPNTQKCCHDTLVRESCGSWFVDGIDVRIVRPVTMQIVSDTDWISWLQISKNLADLGLLTTATNILSSMSTYYPVPWGFYGLPGDKNLARKATHNGTRVWRFADKVGSPEVPNFQREEFLMPVSQSGQKVRLTGQKALYAYFTAQGTEFVTCRKTTRDWIPLE